MDIDPDMTAEEIAEAEAYNEQFVTTDIVLLEADLNAGEGVVLFSEEFLILNPLMQADLMKDWLAILTSQYEAVLEGGIVDIPPTIQ